MAAGPGSGNGAKCGAGGEIMAVRIGDGTGMGSGLNGFGWDRERKPAGVTGADRLEALDREQRVPHNGTGTDGTQTNGAGTDWIGKGMGP